RTFATGNPTIGATGAGYLQSVFSVNADHELLRNVLLNIGGSFENDSFQGISRTDNVYTIAAGVRYLVNRNLFLGGNYCVGYRSSTLEGASYLQNIFTVRVGTQF